MDADDISRPNDTELRYNFITESDYKVVIERNNEFNQKIRPKKVSADTS